MSGILRAAKKNAEAAKNRPVPEPAQKRPAIDVRDLTPYRAAKKIAAAAKAQKP